MNEHQGHPAAPCCGTGDTASASDSKRDPVCGMSVRRATAQWRTDHGGQTYFFCSERCLTRFRRAPDGIA